jgi:uncharacterized protein YecE (DUF72 family)
VDRQNADRIRLVPGRASNPEKRLRYYAEQFPLVEVDSAYYALPAEQTARAWAGKVRKLAEDADETQVVFNNCYRDYAHVNAQQLAGLLS